MNQGRQNNSWIIATVLLLLGTTGNLQAFIDSKHQPEAAFFVPELILFSLILGGALLSLALYGVNERKSRKPGSGTGATSPDRGESPNTLAFRATKNGKFIDWMSKDEIIIVTAMLVLIVGIARVAGILDAIFSYNIPLTMMPISMLIAGLWLGCSVFYVTVYVRRKRKPRGLEAPPRLARSRGQPKEAREE